MTAPFPPPAVALPLILNRIDRLRAELRLNREQEEAFDGIAEDLRWLCSSVELSGHTERAIQRITDLADGSAA